MAGTLPFREPSRRARLELPNAENRARMFAELVNCAAAEKGPDFVGFALVCLMSDGRRISTWNSTYGGAAQLSRQMRREAAAISKAVLKPDDWR